jgi:hypothetical protein
MLDGQDVNGGYSRVRAMSFVHLLRHEEMGLLALRLTSSEQLFSTSGITLARCWTMCGDCKRGKDMIFVI